MAEEKLALNIEGMQCEHCRRSVEEALKAVPGVQKAVVDLAGGTAEVVYEPAATSPEVIRKAVADAGYTVINLNLKRNFMLKDIHQGR